jgi:hypothetical protein
MYYVELQRRKRLVDYCKKGIMCQRGWIKRVIKKVYKMPKVMEKSDESFTHKTSCYLNDIIIRRKCQSTSLTVPLTGNESGSGLAKRSAKFGSKCTALVADLLLRGSLRSPMIEVAHNTV